MRLLTTASCALIALSTSYAAAQARDADVQPLCDPVVSADGTGVRSANGSLVAHSGSSPCPVETVAVVTPVVVVEQPPAPTPLEAVVYFDYDVAALTPEAEVILDDIAEAAAENQPSAVTVEGYADRAGPEDYNQTLSEERAANVQSALVANGLATDVVTTEAYGENRPAVETEDGVALDANRRAVVKLDY
jgi:outer membrane protein OmpA-like peptidoglycan-associated protein